MPAPLRGSSRPAQSNEWGANLNRGPGESATGGGQGLTRAQVRLYVAGYVVLIAGTVGSAWAYHVAVVDELSDALTAQARNTKDYQGQMEYLGGKANVLGSELTDWFVGLWHGRNLAYTLAVLTIVAASLCFYVAFALPDLPPFGDEPPKDPARPRK
jgi:hypothetical protein